MEFTAAAVSIDEDADLWRVGFADAEFNPRRYLRLERAKTPDAGDAELGLDGYAVELDDPSNGCYGGVELFELFPDRAVVAFEYGALPRRSGELVVRFALRGRQLAQLRGCLAKIFDGYGCFVDAGA
jgi:hypothetical protein